MIRPLGPFLYTLEFQNQFLHFSLVFYLLQMQILVSFYFQRANFIKMGDGHNQHDHDEHRKRNKKR